jgi:hypothetical protein
MKISLAVTGQTLNTYKGISSMGSFDVSRIPDIFSKIVINFFGIFLNNNIEISYNLVTKVMFLVLHIISISFVILQTVRLFRYKDKLKALLYVVFALCYVLAINGIYFMCEDGIYSLMYFSYVFMMILPLCLLDRGFEIYGNGAIVMAEYVTVIFLMAGIACYCHFANGEYLSMDLSYRQAENYYNTLITQIKSTQGYEDTMPIAMVGNEIQDATLYRNDILSDFEMSGRDNSLVDSYSSLYFIKYYCGFDAEYVDISQAGIDQKMVDEMPSYPADGSIKVINGTVVVKFSE